MRQIFEISLLCWIKNFLIRNWMLVCDILYSNSNYSNNSNTLSCSSVSIHIKSTSSMYLKYIKEILQRVFIVRTFQKLTHLGGGYKMFCLKGGDKPEKGGCCRSGGPLSLFLLLCSSITFTVCGESKIPFITFWIFWISHARFSSNSLLYKNLVSFVHFWSILVVYKKCWLLYLT